MLDLPEVGFATSVNVHNVRLDHLCDWIEGCITFSDDVVTLSDIVDCLCEYDIYKSQDFAKIFVGNCFQQLEKRAALLGPGGSYKVEYPRVVRTVGWETVPAYSFCLMLSLQILYRSKFALKFGPNYTEQGSLFEQLTEQALQSFGWKTHSTAWSKAATSSLKTKVDELAKTVGELTFKDGIERWSEENAKDGGLDIVCYWGFEDRMSGRPIVYIQCASGDNWRSKRSTPDLALWEKLVDAATKPRRGIAIPFVLLADDFRRASNFEKLFLVLERHRICAPRAGSGIAWLSNTLASELNAWTLSRVAVLPALNPK